MSKYYTEDNTVDLSHLKNWELELVEKFKEVTMLCGEIYDGQINSAAGFYPKGVTIDEIEEAAVDDPTILSPYTRVIRDGSKLKAVFYYDEYKEQINKIVGLLKEAASIYSKNQSKDYGKYIETLASDLKKADFESSEKLWLGLNWSENVDIKLGPIETYRDNLLGIKRAFQSNLRIRDEEEGTNIKDYIDVINASLPMSPLAKDVSKSSFVVRIDKAIAMGGWHAEFIPRTSNYPGDAAYSKYGFKTLVYTNNIKSKQPVINEIVRKIIDSSLNDNNALAKASVRGAIFHEIAEIIFKIGYFDNYNELKNYRDLVVEAHANVMGIKSGAVQVLKGVLSVEEYQYILVSFVAFMFRGLMQGKSNSAVSVYSDGYKLILNYLFEKEALKSYESRIQIDYAKMYSALDGLSNYLSQIVLDSDANAAHELFEKYSSDVRFNSYLKALQEIHIG